MPHIHIKTEISAPIERCFDLMRSVEVHLESTAQTDEEAIAGKTSGLLDEGDTVTWKARHFGLMQRTAVEITRCESPNLYVDEMTRGTFKSFRHEHRLYFEDGVTTMIDDFVFTSPLGIVGKLVDFLFLEKYMRHFLEQRADVIKRIAESAEWRNYLL